jgi:hypothetical protein
VRVYKLSKERRRALTDLAAGVLRLGEPTVFAFEATCRHGLRSNLCLQHWPWIIADLTAAGIVDRALHRVGARRPRWIEGQRQYVDEGVTQIDRRDCIQCGRRLPENHSKFCSKICAGAYRNATRNEEQREAERARKLARAFEYRLQAEAKTCEGCGHSFKPNYPEQRFCSRTCSGSRSVAEKMNGKAHPWANGKGKTGGNAVHHAEQSSLNGDTPPASSAPSDVRIDTSITSHPKLEPRPEPKDMRPLRQANPRSEATGQKILLPALPMAGEVLAEDSYPPGAETVGLSGPDSPTAFCGRIRVTRG